MVELAGRNTEFATLRTALTLTLNMDVTSDFLLNEERAALKGLADALDAVVSL